VCDNVREYRITVHNWQKYFDAALAKEFNVTEPEMEYDKSLFARPGVPFGPADRLIGHSPEVQAKIDAHMQEYRKRKKH
jgi:hypothetical protein